MNLHGILNKGQGRRLLGVGAVMARTAGTSKKIAIAVAVGMMLGGTVAVASSASAHSPSVTTTCEGLTVNLVNYQIKPGTREVPGELITAAKPAWDETTDPGHPRIAPTPDIQATYEYKWQMGEPRHYIFAWFATSPGSGWSPSPDAATQESRVRTAFIPGSPGQPYVAPTVVHHDAEAAVYGPATPAVPANLRPNHVTVTVNGDMKANTDFGTSYNGRFRFVAGQSNTYTVDVTAWDDPIGRKGYTKTFEGTVRDCVVVTHPVRPPRVTPPTCDAAGIVTLPTSDYYEWVLQPTGVYIAVRKDGGTLSGTTRFNPGPLDRLTGDACVININVTPPVYIAPTCDAAGSINLGLWRHYEWKLQSNGVYIAVRKDRGSHLSGTTRFGPAPLAQLNCSVARTPGVPVTPPTFVAGTCRDVGWVVANNASSYEWVVTGVMTARSYAAVAKAGFTLTGTTTFGPFDLSQIPSQSVDAAALCYVAPPAVAGEVKGVVKNAPAKAAPAKAAPVKAAPAPAVAPAVKTLAFTGAETVPLGLSGLLALLLGAVLTVASRQRPKQARE